MCAKSTRRGVNVQSVHGSLRLERKLIGRAEQLIPGQTRFGKLGRQITNPRGSICQWAPGSQLMLPHRPAAPGQPFKGNAGKYRRLPTSSAHPSGHCCTALVAHVGHRGSGNGHLSRALRLGDRSRTGLPSLTVGHFTPFDMTLGIC